MSKVVAFLAIFIFPFFGICQEFDSRFTIEVGRNAENYSVYEANQKFIGVRSIREKNIGNNRTAEFFILNDALKAEVKNTFPLPENHDFQWADVAGGELVLLSHYALKVIQSTIDELAIISIDSESGQFSIIPFKSMDLSEVEDFYSFGGHSLLFGRNAAGLMLQSVDHNQPEKINRKILFESSYKILSINKLDDAKSLLVLASKKDTQQNDQLHIVAVSEMGEIIEKSAYYFLEDKRTNLRNISVINFKSERVYSGVFGPRNNNHSSGLINVFINDFGEFSLWRNFLNELSGFFDEIDSSLLLGKKKRMDRRVKLGRIPVLNETVQLWNLQTSENGIWHHFEQFSSQLKSESDYQRSFIEGFTKKNKYFVGNRFVRELPQIPGGYKNGNRPYRLNSEYIAYAAHLVQMNDKQEIIQYYRIPLESEMQFLPTASGVFYQNEEKLIYAYFDGKDILSSRFEHGKANYLNKPIPFDHDQKNIEITSIQLQFDSDGKLIVSGKGRIKDEEGSRKTAFFVERYTL